MTEPFLPFALPDITNDELGSVEAVLKSGWLTTGAVTREFEAKFAARVGARHAIAVNSCTAALHLALEAIGLGEDDEVITTPYTFAASAEVIRYFKARPVFVDVERKTFNMRADLMEAAITSRTKAIIPVHIAGLPADLDEIGAVAARHGLPVIEDAAHAFPVAYKGRPIGSISTFTCFSFYATKTITTGEGGMITTDDDALAERCRIMALHGISKDAWNRYTAEGSWYYEIIAPGYKYNLTDMASALGVAQLGRADVMAGRRREIAAAFTAAFSAIPEVETPVDLPDRDHAWHLYMLRLNDGARLSRNDLIEELRKRQIGTSVHFIPLHTHPYYRQTYGYRPEDFPVANGQYQREVSLPIYSRMNDGDVRRVIDSVCSALGH